MARTRISADGNGLATLPQREVGCTGQIPVSADRVWSQVRNFYGTWHPAINTMVAEIDNAGHQIRAFTVNGDDSIYREQLTWFSDSDMSMAYKHVEGIQGVEDYNAQLCVAVTDKSTATITLSAQLIAKEPRATEIARGTQAIFEDAITALKSLAQNSKVAAAKFVSTVDSGTNYSGSRTRVIDATPKLVLSYIDNHTNTDDTLCLFLHGIGGNRSNWDHQLTAVSPLCRAASLDLRGYGDSALGESQSTVEDYCADILRVADSFGANKLILCGLSYGAWLATSFAMRHADRLAALVLSGGCTGMSQASLEEREAFRESREVPLSEGQTPADFAPAVVSYLVSPHSTDAVKNELLASMQSIPAKTYADALRCFTNPPEKFNFSDITIPVLLMTGENDKLAPPSEIIQVAKRILTTSADPDVRFECLSRAGHVCNLDVPQAYNSPLLDLVHRVVR